MLFGDRKDKQNLVYLQLISGFGYFDEMIRF